MDKNKCDIKAEVKLRNGYPNWWCFTHNAPARGEKGKKLERCLKADEPPIKDDEKICIDLANYPGGVGVWGSLEAVIDTKREVSEKGVHVHLREEEGAHKVVDNTFKEVYIKIPTTSLHSNTEWVKINEEVACAYTASTVFDKKLKVLRCKHCNEQHVDAGWFAIHKHKKHFCTYCGRDFIDSEHGISNPIYYIQQIFSEILSKRSLITVDRELDVSQKDYPGGIQVWASNPAIIWTADRPEEAGIHVHLFNDKSSPPLVDDTFGKVKIDGVELDDIMIRYYMVQKSLDYLKKYIVSLKCPKCKSDHFDIGDNAINPHKTHTCEHCNHTFEDSTRYKGVVSNPSVERIKLIEKKQRIA